MLLGDYGIPEGKVENLANYQRARASQRGSNPVLCRYRSGLFLFNSELFAHESAGPPPHRGRDLTTPHTVGLSGRTRGSKSDLDARNRNCLL
jgi:hypothetical protein